MKLEKSSLLMLGRCSRRGPKSRGPKSRGIEILGYRAFGQVPTFVEKELTDETRIAFGDLSDARAGGHSASSPHSVGFQSRESSAHGSFGLRHLRYLLLALGLASLLLPGKLLAQQSSPTYTNPLGISIGDPDVLHIPGHYYIYGTGGDTFTSTNLVDWVPVGNTAPAGADAWWSNAFWAPEVYQVKHKFYMFYSGQWRDNPTNELENFRIGVAVADQPTGPFQNIQNRPIFEPGYPIIDADVLFDTDGRVYLYYSRCCYKHSVESELAEWAKAKGWYDNIEESWVYGVELKPDFSGVIGQPVLLLRPPVKLSDPQSAWEDLSVTTHTVNRRWTEGPSSFKHGHTYYLMYAANSVAAGGDYATGYATSDSPLGPFRPGANNPIIFRNTPTGGNVTTTGHTCWTLSPDGTQMYVLYGGVIATPNPTSRFPRRVLFLDRMDILSDGMLVAHSPTVTPQPYPSADKVPPR